MSLPSWFKYADDYMFLLRDAHRRPSQAVCPPAAVWHTAHSRPEDKKDAEWHTQIEERIGGVFCQAVRYARDCAPSTSVEISNLHKNPVSVDAHTKWCAPELVLLRNTYTYEGNVMTLRQKNCQRTQRYECVVISGVWDALDYWIRFEAFDEVFSMTCCVHAAGQSGQPTHGFREHVKGIAEYCNHRFQLLENNNDDIYLSRNCSSELRDSVSEIYEKMWNKFASSILDADRTKRPRSVVFANFRGLVLPVRSVPAACRRMWIDPSTQPNRGANLKTRMEGVVEAITDSAASRWAEAILPLLIAQDTTVCAQDTAVCEKTRRPPFEASEFTISLMGGRRYLYGTGFGRQHETSRVSDDARAPINYIALAFHDEWRQIGRMVSTLNTIGTVRTAALFDLRLMMDRDQVLYCLEHELRKYHTVLDHNSLRKEEDNALEKLRRLLPKIENEEKGFQWSKPLFSEVKAFAAARSVEGWPLIGGLAHRFQRRCRKRKVEKIRSELKDGVDNLKLQTPVPSEDRRERLKKLNDAIRACETYLSCDDVTQFRTTVLFQVKRALNGMDSVFRLGGLSYRAARSNYYRGIFKALAAALRISRIGGYPPYKVYVKGRLDSAYKLIESIDARFKQLSELERSLRERLEFQRMRQQQEVIQELQTLAEFAFWLVLAPYYLGHVIEALFEHWIGSELRPEPVFSFKPFSLGTVLGLLLGGVIVLVRLAKQRARRLSSSAKHTTGED